MKKSETIEIRIDHKTKLALQDKANAENKTVSEVLRKKIERYLNPRQPRLPARLKNAVLVLTGLMAGLFGSAIIIPSANAEDFGLTFDGEIVNRVADGHRRQSIKYELTFDEKGGTVKLPVSASDIYFELTVKSIESNGTQAASIKIGIIQIDGPDRNVIAEPQLIAAFDEVSRIEIGSEAGAQYHINLVPSRLPK